MKGTSYASICVRPSARDKHYRHLCRLVEATIARAAVYLAKKLCIQHIEHIELVGVVVGCIGHIEHFVVGLQSLAEVEYISAIATVNAITITTFQLV